MGKKDITLNAFLGDAHIFADLMNGCCFQGNTLIRPEELLPLDSAQYTRTNQGKPGKKYRDLKKLLFQEEPIAILAVENQDRRDFRMPVRCMRYDADEYERQIKAFEAESKSTQSAFEPETVIRLLPVFTLVLYYGREEWTIPGKLYDMVDFHRKARRLRGQVPDYPLRIISVTKDMDIDLFHTELREVMGILQRMDDKESMKAFFEADRAAFSQLTDQAFEVIVNCTNSRKLRKYITENREGGCVDMCRAFDEWIEDCRKEALIEGKKAGRKEGEKRGIKEGEARLARLIQLLENEGRIADIFEAAKNATIRNRLYKKYGL